MEIRIIADKYDKIVPVHFPKAEAGINCRSNIALQYSDGALTTTVKSDEFESSASRYCPDVDIKKFEIKTDVIKELKGTEIVELVDDDIDSVIKELGDFSANFFFNLTSSNEDKDKFMYKYLDTPQNVESGIILYRNAFSISSYEGKRTGLD